jgi:phage regulator Rha-like protein
MTSQNIPQTQSMTSREIAELTSKAHSNVMRDIRAMIEKFEETSKNRHDSDLKCANDITWYCKTETYVDGNGRNREYYVLDRDTTYCLVAGYDPVARMRIIKRWQELEAKIAKPALQPANIDFDLLIDKERTALELLKNRLNAATLFNVPEHIAQQEATKLILTEVGVDYTPLMLAAPAQDDIATQDEMLEPTDLAKRLGIRNAIKMNLILEHLGLQTKVRDTWLPTLEGEDLCIKHAWSKGTKSGYNLKWRVTAINAMLDRQFKLGTLNARDINE